MMLNLMIIGLMVLIILGGLVFIEATEQIDERKERRIIENIWDWP